MNEIVVIFSQLLKTELLLSHLLTPNGTLTLIHHLNSRYPALLSTPKLTDSTRLN